MVAIMMNADVIPVTAVSARPFVEESRNHEYSTSRSGEPYKSSAAHVHNSTSITMRATVAALLLCLVVSACRSQETPPGPPGPTDGPQPTGPPTGGPDPTGQPTGGPEPTGPPGPPTGGPEPTGEPQPTGGPEPTGGPQPTGEPQPTGGPEPTGPPAPPSRIWRGVF
ncbi:proline-rich protein 2-like isoform X7 [Schistocerca serialis cubense]|uniref:proline-rich protein 2-like isoform X7 n=1 Tax=Schistocerca serialis cubense TaxID=2023355 RepID=UPI00214E295F|nr:proline-rich protein 2-like isoform X7 [Schistocerca serialis cubense]